MSPSHNARYKYRLWCRASAGVPDQTTYAEVATSSPPSSPTSPIYIAGPPCTAAATTAPPTSQTFPPLIADSIENWVMVISHFAHLSRILGHAPHAKPYKSGIKFLPESTQEYRTVQRFDLHGLDLDWHSYALPEERALKVAIYGLPGSTPLEAVSQGLATLSFEAEHVSRISGTGGRPGLIFFARLRRSQDLIPAIYEVTELLSMPNIKIEAWRGNKRGPSQCYRCQQFRHSSQHCHRKLACLKCAE